jgi:hypothetical protein
VLSHILSRPAFATSTARSPSGGHGGGVHVFRIEIPYRLTGYGMSGIGTIRPRWPPASRSAYWVVRPFSGELRVSAVQSFSRQISNLSTIAKATQAASGTRHHAANPVEPAETIDCAEEPPARWTLFAVKE